MKATKVFSTPHDGKHYFFGYYDKSPLSKDETKLLALQVDFIDRLPGANDKAVIGYFDLTNNGSDFVPLATTKTFNWQQGCMLQWLGPDFNSTIIFNDLVDEKFSCVTLDLRNRETNIFPIAVYAVHPNGKLALCIDNERHHWCRRGYSYDGISNLKKNKNIVEGDGIFSLDLETAQIRRIIAIETMNQIRPLASMSDGANYLEHLMISPIGDRFAFLHRWKSYGGIYARLYTANLNGGDLRLLNDSGRMSHFCWRNESQLLGWGGLTGPISNLRRYKTIAKYFIKPLMPLYRRVARGNSIDGNSALSRAVTGDSYILFDDRTLKKERVAVQDLIQDGHPSFSLTNTDLLLTDTYPGLDGKCKLYIFDMIEKRLETLDELQSIPQYDNSPLRCDLHPKWSYCGQYVCIDTLHEGSRGIFLYKIEGGTRDDRSTINTQIYAAPPKKDFGEGAFQFINWQHSEYHLSK